MSDTPRTNKAIMRTQGMFRAASACNGFTEHARELERELAAVTKERDEWKAKFQAIEDKLSEAASEAAFQNMRNQ